MLLSPLCADAEALAQALGDLGAEVNEDPILSYYCYIDFKEDLKPKSPLRRR